jgi:uncharacterized membrane protein YphA (DoxX/SURF4 family)
MRIYLGRHVYGLAAIIFGIITFLWRDFTTWQQNIPRGAVVVYLVAALELFGGMAIQWPKAARLGAIALGITYTVFALSWVPRIFREPLVYDRWGNFFEQLSIVSGALIVYALTPRSDSGPRAKIARIGYIFFGICVISFALEQLFYLSATASFVPKWIPPGQLFWAITTTVAFALDRRGLAIGTLRTARLSANHIDGDGLCLTGMVADTLCRPSQII